MKKQMSMKAYLLEKCLIGYGIINGIINGGIFYALEGKHVDATFGLIDILADFGITALLLGMILFYCAAPLTLQDVNKGKFKVEKYDNKIVSMLPQKKFLTALYIGLITMVITVALVSVISIALTLPLNVKMMTLYKGVACTIAGAIAGYLTINKVTSTYQESVEKQA